MKLNIKLDSAEVGKCLRGETERGMRRKLRKKYNIVEVRKDAK